jgi:hypothetical protein
MPKRGAGERSYKGIKMVLLKYTWKISHTIVTGT